MNTYETLLVDDRDDRVVVTLHRPEARNAIDTRMVAELHEVCASLEATPRALVVTGGDGVFAGGADIAELRERGVPEALSAPTRGVLDRIAALPMPTVAAVDGYALGGGAELAYACDLRIATTRAVFGNPEPGLGIIAAAGATYRLRELLGVSVAKQVLLGGRNLDAHAALHHGLLLEVVEPAELLAAAHRLVDGIARWAPLAVRLTKSAIDHPQAHPLVDDLAQAVLYETPAKYERMTRFLEKRTRA
ncbi:enoyl-CoA hydratase/isomerase family protein [Nocardia higoensis]|uniref:enoyl-CoA hydratase/isomerase family protein n=1 Tax=Nocardia higoensis TaxID=228599 RepID=UPI0002E44A87|nr:enoyl-CoA hydratase/isomerase family protein [Nocardia higoensis]